jgi:hypothetical protein
VLRRIPARLSPFRRPTPFLCTQTCPPSPIGNWDVHVAFAKTNDCKFYCFERKAIVADVTATVQLRVQLRSDQDPAALERAITSEGRRAAKEFFCARSPL